MQWKNKKKVFFPILIIISLITIKQNIYTINFQTSLSPWKETLYPLAVLTNKIFKPVYVYFHFWSFSFNHSGFLCILFVCFSFIEHEMMQCHNPVASDSTSRAKWPMFKSWLHSIQVWPLKNYLSSLSLSFLTHRMGMKEIIITSL